MEDWLGTVSHWAEGEALKLVGGVVSCNLPCRSATLNIDSPDLWFSLCEEPCFQITKNDLIPQSGIDKLFTQFDGTNKGTLICLVLGARFECLATQFEFVDLVRNLRPKPWGMNDVAMNATAYAHRDALVRSLLPFVRHRVAKHDSSFMSKATLSAPLGYTIIFIAILTRLMTSSKNRYRVIKWAHTPVM